MKQLIGRDVDAVLLPEVEKHHNPLGIKGIDELSICGAGAAVANAVYNATGIRVREFPITLDKILINLPNRVQSIYVEVKRRLGRETANGVSLLK